MIKLKAKKPIKKKKMMIRRKMILIMKKRMRLKKMKMKKRRRCRMSELGINIFVSLFCNTCSIYS